MWITGRPILTDSNKSPHRSTGCTRTLTTWATGHRTHQIRAWHRTPCRHAMTSIWHTQCREFVATGARTRARARARVLGGVVSCGAAPQPSHTSAPQRKRFGPEAEGGSDLRGTRPLCETHLAAIL